MAGRGGQRVAPPLLAGGNLALGVALCLVLQAGTFEGHPTVL